MDSEAFVEFKEDLRIAEPYIEDTPATAHLDAASSHEVLDN